jgi:Flp pilus assembly protein TadD
MNFKIGLGVFALVVSSLLPATADAAPSGIELLAQGDRLWEQGKVEEARKSFELAVSTNPGSVDARLKLGGMLLSNKDYSAAIQTYQQTISLDGNNAKAWMGLGFAYLHTGRQELSRAAFGEAVRSDPKRKPQLARLMEKHAE